MANYLKAEYVYTCFIPVHLQHSVCRFFHERDVKILSFEVEYDLGLFMDVYLSVRGF